MEPTIINNDEVEIDLKELFLYLWGRILYILAAGIAFATIALAITLFLIQPKYTSSTKMYVLNRQTNESITSSDLQSSTYLTKDYIELIKTRTVIESVIARLGLDMNYEEVLNLLSVSAESDTRVIQISVTYTDPYLACDLANTIREVAASHIQKVMNIEAVNVADQANVPIAPSSPSLKKNVLLGALAGMFLVIAVFSVQFMMNDKIITQEDVERYLGLGILGAMPIDEDELKTKKKRKKRRKKTAKQF